MIEKPTVLILGAGASAHLHYPIGSVLLRDVCALARSSPEPVLAQALERWDDGALESFCRRLGRSGRNSVDAFLEANQDDSELLGLGKLLIAYRLKQHENPDQLFPEADHGWYSDLFHAMATSQPDDFARNRLSIVNFNYDRSLDVFLHETLAEWYGLSAEEALQLLQAVPVVRPHGTLGTYPGVPYSRPEDAEQLVGIADAIKVVSELDDTPDGFCSEDFRLAHELLREAEWVYFLGFGFHETNLRRFRFFTPENVSTRTIRGTLNMHLADRRDTLTRLGEYGLTGEHLHSGNCYLFFREGQGLREVCTP